MIQWFGHPVKVCECGFTTPDENDFLRHLQGKGHKEKPDTKPEKNSKAKKNESKEE